MGFYRRFVNLLHPGRLQRDFDDELEFHRQMRLRKAREQGLSPAEAELKPYGFIRKAGAMVSRRLFLDLKSVSSALP